MNLGKVEILISKRNNSGVTTFSRLATVDFGISCDAADLKAVNSCIIELTKADVEKTVTMSDYEEDEFLSSPEKCKDTKPKALAIVRFTIQADQVAALHRLLKNFSSEDKNVNGLVNILKEKLECFQSSLVHTTSLPSSQNLKQQTM